MPRAYYGWHGAATCAARFPVRSRGNGWFVMDVGFTVDGARTVHTSLRAAARAAIAQHADATAWPSLDGAQFWGCTRYTRDGDVSMRNESRLMPGDTFTRAYHGRTHTMRVVAVRASKRAAS